MLKLAIDTATDVLSIALTRDGTLLGENTLDAERKHLERLLPEIHGILTASGCGVKDIDAIVAGTGPGTFSGLRVGIATARGLAQALEVPLDGSSTLRAQALGIAALKCKPGDLILPAIDAKRGQVFSRLYRMEEGGGVTHESDISCKSPASFVKDIESVGKEVLAAGNGAVAYYDLFNACELINMPVIDDGCHRVRAVFHFKTDEEAANEKTGIPAVLPAYIREPDADVTAVKRKKNTWLK
ncbi:MAG: tRNA (adenosine(37)-N6)-threonylcarbamoyltransferase complex dimerization subunit type 1 TsaB [Thermoleophilia bacterium]